MVKCIESGKVYKTADESSDYEHDKPDLNFLNILMNLLMNFLKKI